MHELERRYAAPRPPHLWLAFVDEQGRVLDDRSDVIRPWIGRQLRESSEMEERIAALEAQMETPRLAS